MLHSVRSPTPAHPQPFQIKWEVYFSRELCRSSLLCRCYDFACICVCIVGHGYTIIVGFSLYALWTCMWSIHIIESKLPLLWKNFVLFYWMSFIFICSIAYWLLSMSSQVTYWCHFQQMICCFRCRWICLLVSENHHLVWRCLLFDYPNSTDSHTLKSVNFCAKSKLQML